MLSVLSLINPIFEKTFTGHSLPQQLAISRALCSHLWLQGLLSSLCLCGSWQGVKSSCPVAVRASVLGGLEQLLGVSWSGIWDLGSVAAVPAKPGKG